MRTRETFVSLVFLSLADTERPMLCCAADGSILNPDPSEVNMRMLKLAGTALILIAATSMFVVGDRLNQDTWQGLQAPGGETRQPNPDATPTPTSTPEPTGIDTSAPEVLSIDLAHDDVDTSASSQPLTISLQIIDDLSGLQRAILRFEPAAGGTQFVVFEVNESHRVSGDRRDGIYVATATLPKYAVHGRWYLSELAVIDNANNGAKVTGPWRSSALAAASGDAPLYFVNGSDDGQLPPTPTADPGPLPADSKVEATPWANELMLPMVSE